MGSPIGGVVGAAESWPTVRAAPVAVSANISKRPATRRWLTRIAGAPDRRCGTCCVLTAAALNRCQPRRAWVVVTQWHDAALTRRNRPGKPALTPQRGSLERRRPRADGRRGDEAVGLPPSA